jgi:hypothetical protein
VERISTGLLVPHYGYLVYSDLLIEVVLYLVYSDLLIEVVLYLVYSDLLIEVVLWLASTSSTPIRRSTCTSSMFITSVRAGMLMP